MTNGSFDYMMAGIVSFLQTGANAISHPVMQYDVYRPAKPSVFVTDSYEFKTLNLT